MSSAILAAELPAVATCQLLSEGAVVVIVGQVVIVWTEVASVAATVQGKLCYPARTTRYSLAQEQKGEKEGCQA